MLFWWLLEILVRSFLHLCHFGVCAQWLSFRIQIETFLVLGVSDFFKLKYGHFWYYKAWILLSSCILAGLS